MRVICSACGAVYTIADEKVPAGGVRIRCRKCQAVFSIPPKEAGAPPGAARPPAPPRTFPAQASPAPAVPPAKTAPAPPAPREALEPQAIRPAPLPTIPPAGEPLQPPARPAEPKAAAPAENLRLSEARSGMSPIPDGLSAEEHARHERARRLARVLASDIAIYNRDKCQRGVRDGNLVAVLGYEIKKSWEVYKERVTPELANSTPYFRDALNEMLGGGKKIF